MSVFATTEPGQAESAGLARRVAFAAQITAVSGFVDAVGALHLLGLNVAFMSGNTTSFATAILQGDRGLILAGAAIIATFVAGAALATRLALMIPARLLFLSIMGVEALLFAAALGLSGKVPDLVATLPLCFAMAIQNVLRDTVAGSEIGRTFVTGTLYSLGAGLARIRRRGNATKAGLAALSWCSIVAGGAAGAAVMLRFGLEASLWTALAILAAMTALHMVWPAPIPERAPHHEDAARAGPSDGAALAGATAGGPGEAGSSARSV
ncbi:YoaK family protein [Acuticoccus kandeliae]|uniref:YoaK family protein n=1 Tax=Acuticoccus kandeliae TaxID=2073160 RepID=UPI000D3EB1D9|nr:YoaK family protein [Acuticoccus kandeliae]